MPLDRHKLVERVCQTARFLLEGRKIREIKHTLLSLLVTPEVPCHMLKRFKPPPMEAAHHSKRWRPVGREFVRRAWRGQRQLTPGSIGILERDLAVEACPTGVPGR